MIVKDYSINDIGWLAMIEKFNKKYLMVVIKDYEWLLMIGMVISIG